MTQLLLSSAFYAFAGVLLTSACLVVTVRNPVHAVFFLILAFFNAACLFVLLGAEFLAMLMVVVYVGAVAVLFLFVVMMLDMEIEDFRHGMKKHLPLGLLVGAILLVEFFMVWSLIGEGQSLQPYSSVSNTRALGQILYTRHIYLFQTAGLILLVAMIGAIVLTFSKPSHVHYQDTRQQSRRSSRIRLKKIKPGEGL